MPFRKAKALYACKAEHDSELSFTAGTVFENGEFLRSLHRREGKQRSDLRRQSPFMPKEGLRRPGKAEKVPRAGEKGRGGVSFPKIREQQTPGGSVERG